MLKIVKTVFLLTFLVLFSFSSGQTKKTIQTSDDSDLQQIIQSLRKPKIVSIGVDTIQSVNRLVERQDIPPFNYFVKQAIDELNSEKQKGYNGYLLMDQLGKFTGVTETLYYQGTSYMWNEYKPGDKVLYKQKYVEPCGKSYCCGLTLEIFHRAMKKRDQYLGINESMENWNGLGPKGIFIFKKLWNVIPIKYSDTGEIVTSAPSPARALALSGLGQVICDSGEGSLEDIKPYDFCDYTRVNGSGHSVIFIDWIKGSDGEIKGFKYYSSQNSTMGQGYNTEYFNDAGGKVLRKMFRAGRVYDHPSYCQANRIREADFIAD